MNIYAHDFKFESKGDIKTYSFQVSCDISSYSKTFLGDHSTEEFQEMIDDAITESKIILENEVLRSFISKMHLIHDKYAGEVLQIKTKDIPYQLRKLINKTYE